MRLGALCLVENTHAVAGHGVDRPVVFVEHPNIVVEDGKDVFGRIVHQRHGRKRLGVANKGGLQTGIHGVAIVIVDDVFLEGGEGLAQFDGGKRT